MYLLCQPPPSDVDQAHVNKNGICQKMKFMITVGSFWDILRMAIHKKMKFMSSAVAFRILITVFLKLLAL